MKLNLFFLYEKLILKELHITFKNNQKLRSNFQSHRLKNTVLFHRSKIMNFPSLLLPTSTQSTYSNLHEKLLLWLSLQTKLLKRKSCHCLHIKQHSRFKSLIYKSNTKVFNKLYCFKFLTILKEFLLLRDHKTEVVLMDRACFLAQRERIWSFKAFMKTSIIQKSFFALKLQNLWEVLHSPWSKETNRSIREVEYIWSSIYPRQLVTAQLKNKLSFNILVLVD